MLAATEITLSVSRIEPFPPDLQLIIMMAFPPGLGPRAVLRQPAWRRKWIRDFHLRRLMLSSQAAVSTPGRSSASLISAEIFLSKVCRRCCPEFGAPEPGDDIPMNRDRRGYLHPAILRLEASNPLLDAVPTHQPTAKRCLKLPKALFAIDLAEETAQSSILGSLKTSSPAKGVGSTSMIFP